LHQEITPSGPKLGDLITDQASVPAIDRQRYHFGFDFERVEQDGNGARVHFRNGRIENVSLSKSAARRVPMTQMR
jgi:hypothetical protein